MKKILFLFTLILSCQLSLHAQENKVAESVTPTENVEISRKVYLLDIEGKDYHDVTVNIESLSPNPLVSDKYRVKVLVTDSDGKKIYKNKFKDCYLYIFSNGQIQIGKPRLNKVVLGEPIMGKSGYGIIREKEGVF